MRKVLFLSVLLLSFCFCLFAENKDYTYTNTNITKQVAKRTFTLMIDRTFTGPESDVIRESAKRWEIASGGMITFDFDIQNDLSKYQPLLDYFDYSTDNNFVNINETKRTIIIWKVAPTDIQLISVEKLIGLRLVGLAPGKSILLIPNRTDSRAEFASLVAHELGHAIGLRHTKSLMDNDTVYNCISQIDIDQFCSIYDCKNVSIKVEKEHCEIE